FLFRSPSPPPPRSLLVAYTTLFRSALADDRRPIPGAAAVTRASLPQGVRRRGVAVLGSLVEGRQKITVGSHGDRRDAELVHAPRSEEHTSELQSRFDLVCRLLLEKK